MTEHQFTSVNVSESENINQFIPKDDRDAGGLPNILHVSRGTRVMLIRNIATDQGLVNGALGFVEKILYNDEYGVSSVLVSFDDRSIGKLFLNSDYNAVEITKNSQEFYYHGHSLVRTQFPLMPAWACTIHKVQGITCERIVESVGNTLSVHL
ncbi:ATP-dependent DNA helicase PIF1-like [Mercenaria mercenaria]|uniref:ATP-dependent DNA helicase PIF1-like n=1 Tax=Mercenaria mercenaria TaxID=6596 RepID=UPI00234FA52D|nr:ATP-dependent DNA helicase PIF1-like [Mercenaria mercenaria]